MYQLTCEQGIHCGSINVFPEDGQTWGLFVSWKKGVNGVPNERAFTEAIELSIKECKEKGARYIGSRVVTMTEGVDETLTAERAALLRVSLSTRGFKQCGDRVEYRMDLTDALARLGEQETASELVWNCVDTDSEPSLAQAAGLLKQASEGDPSSHSSDDAMGFLRGLIEEKETVQAPERIQIGMCGSNPAAVIALMVNPSDGWSTIYYLAVLPPFRKRGFGTAAMLQGLDSLKAMGGMIYHDGTSAENAAARALFAHLDHSPFRVMEEWRLKS
jgi:GNAT superfamily N-acetyltransferase